MTCLPSAETALSRVTPEALDIVFKTNAFGPILTAKVRNTGGPEPRRLLLNRVSDCCTCLSASSME